MTPPRSQAKAAARPAAKRATKPQGARFSLAETMRALEQAGSAQTRRTYARHGAQEPMFGVSFATLKTLVKRIGVDHDLALALKVADPARMKPSELDRWAREHALRMCGLYVTLLAAEGPHGAKQARAWLASPHAGLRAAGWALTGHLANLDEAAPEPWFRERLAQIERSIHRVTNAEREAMNTALITIGGRSPALRKAALAAARRIGKVHVDHGDTACKTPDAVPYLEKLWAHAKAKAFDSPAAQERAREPMRTRC
jgi:hypothetical protein